MRAATGLAGLVGVLAAALPAITDAAAPADMPELVVWARAHLTGVEDWPLIGFTPTGITLASPAGATLRPDGLVEGDLRQEFFEPIELNGQVMRSATARWRVDCAKQKFAVLTITLYARNNLQDRVGERISAKPAWLARDEMSTDPIEAICEAVRSGEPIDPPPPQR